MELGCDVDCTAGSRILRRMLRTECCWGAQESKGGVT